MRMLLERAMGRTSSTLSPGHRHFSAQVILCKCNVNVIDCNVETILTSYIQPFISRARWRIYTSFWLQTKELIAEIELLEEEVANREQHVLSLYRSIFEQCTSRPSSQQCSVVTSPAHSKSESRKHPSIISSAFCSSKKFPLRTLQALATMNDSVKRNSQSKTKHASFFSGKTEQHIQKSCSENAKVNLLFVPDDRTTGERRKHLPSNPTLTLLCPTSFYHATMQLNHFF